MDETELALLIDLHLGGERQGPGSRGATERALALSGLEGRAGLRLADIGCGTGAATLDLARRLDAEITAVDFLAPFLERLSARAEAAGLGARITTLEAAMEDLPFAEASLDAIWSEGAIYNMGFAAGVRAWKRFLKPGGVLAVSELTWLTASRAPALTAHWTAEYPEVGLASEKIAVLEAEGFTPLGYFPLEESAWLDHYYAPMRARFADFLARHGHSLEARAIVAAEEAEIALYEAHRDQVSYGFYIARKV